MIMNEYEREMQEQAEYISRWKLRKEIKKKLRALRKMLKADEASFPQLKMISRKLDNVENPLEPCVMQNPEQKLNPYKDLNIHITHTHVQSYKARYTFTKYPLPHLEEVQSYKVRYTFTKYPPPHLEEFGESFGRQLMQEGLIKVKIYDGDSENIGVAEMQIDVVVEDR